MATSRNHILCLFTCFLIVCPLVFSAGFLPANAIEREIKIQPEDPQIGGICTGQQTNLSLLNPSQIRDLCRQYSQGAMDWLLWLEYNGYWPTDLDYTYYYMGIANGTAGIGTAFLKVFQQTGNQTYLACAERAAGCLRLNVYEGGGGYYWHVFTMTSQVETGQANGVSGIGTFFLQLFQQTGNLTWLDFAKGAAQWLISQAEPSGGGYRWLGNNTGTDHYTGQDNGAAGIGTFFLDMFEGTGNATYLDYAKGAAQWLISIKWPGEFCWAQREGGTNQELCTGQSEGNAGIGTFFLDLFSHTGNLTYLTVTEGVAGWLQKIKKEYNGFYWNTYSTLKIISSGWAGGAAGIGTFFLDVFQSTGNQTYLDYANSAAQWLLANATQASGGYRWENYVGSEKSETGFYSGVTGIEAFFHELFASTGNQTYLTYAKGAVQWLLSQMQTGGGGFYWRNDTKSEEILTSLGAGVAGIGVGFLEAANRPWSTDSLQYAESTARWLVSVAEPSGAGYRWKKSELGSLEYQNASGTAGIGKLFIEAFLHTGNSTYLDYIRGVAERIIALARPNGTGYKWLESSYHFTGLISGAAGIAGFLLQAFSCTGNETYLNYSKGAAEWLISMARSAGGGYSWCDGEESSFNQNYTGYMHGAAGIGEFFLDLFVRTGNQTYLNYSRGAAEWLTSVAQSSNGGYRWLRYTTSGEWSTGLQQGAAGIGLFFARVFTRTGNLTYFNYARGAAQWLISIANESEGGYIWCNQIGGPYSPYFLEGTAGIGTFFLEAFAVSGNATYLTYAKGTAQWLSANATASDYGICWPSEDDFYPNMDTGAAGIGTFLQQLSTSTGNQSYLDLARKTCQWLVSVANTSDAGCHWMDPKKSQYNTGYWEGMAGIGSFLFQCDELDLQPPTIGIPIATKLVADTPIEITLIVEDDFEVDTVTLRWCISGSAGLWQNVTMMGCGGLYWVGKGVIPAQPVGTSIKCMIFTNDTAGRQGLNDNGGNFFTFTVPSGGDGGDDLTWLWILLIIVMIGVAIILGVLAIRSYKHGVKKQVKRQYTAQVTRSASFETSTRSQSPAIKSAPLETTLPLELASVPIIAEEEMKDTAPGVYTYRGGRIVGPKFVYKVKVKNATTTSITDVVVTLVSYPGDCMKLTTEEMRRVGKIEPGGFRSLEFELQPMKDCVEGSLISSIIYMDAQNVPHTMAVTPFTLKSVCDLMEPLNVSETDFDALVARWAKTSETITFKGEDIQALAADVFTIFESKNFQPVVQHSQENPGEIVVESKGIAIGKYTKRKLALVVRVRGSTTGPKGDGDITCIGYAEDDSMLAACLSEVLDEFRKPLVRLLRKVLKENKNAMDLLQLKATLKVEANVLADAIRQQNDLLFLHGGETVASMDFLAEFINNMRADYNSVPIGELEKELRPVGKSMRSIVQDLITTGKLRAIWIGADEIKFKAERHKVAIKFVYYLAAFISSLVTILVFLKNYFK